MFNGFHWDKKPQENNGSQNWYCDLTQQQYETLVSMRESSKNSELKIAFFRTATDGSRLIAGEGFDVRVRFPNYSGKDILTIENNFGKIFVAQQTQAASKPKGALPQITPVKHDAFFHDDPKMPAANDNQYRAPPTVTPIQPGKH